MTIKEYLEKIEAEKINIGDKVYIKGHDFDAIFVFEDDGNWNTKLDDNYIVRP